MIAVRTILSAAALCALAAIAPGSRLHADDSSSTGTPASPASPVAVPESLSAGKRAAFLGVFTHVEPRANLAEKLVSLKSVLAANPEIAGITLKVQWRQLHPEKERLDWAGLEALIAEAARAGKLVNLALLTGAASPDWIYSEGAEKTVPVAFGLAHTNVPVPWNPKFMELHLADLRELAARYGGDARIFQVIVQGHTYNGTGEEMHAPGAEAMKPYGWSREVVLENWRYWIDRYAELFPRHRLGLVISQMYRGGDEDLPRIVASYFVNKLAGRAVLQTHQLAGRVDRVAPSGQVCASFAELAPNCHETVLSFKENPDRQGSAAMTLYNARQMGDNLLYLQLWRRDAQDPVYAHALCEAWDRYGALSLSEMKAQLIANGLYVAPEK